MALSYFADMLGYSANVEYDVVHSNFSIDSFYAPANNTLGLPEGTFIDNSWAGSTKTANTANTFSGGKSYVELLAEAWKKICPWGTCGAFVIETFVDETTYTYMGMNKYHVIMSDFSGKKFQDSNYTSNPTMFHKQMMCVDTISQAAAMAKLAAQPPITLVQDYFECSQTLTSAVLSSIGNAAGSAGLYMSVIVGAAGFIFVQCTRLILNLTTGGEVQLLDIKTKREVLEKYADLKVNFLCL